ncbi:hypothetical protein [Magnetospirillum sp. UT-4]|uniref:hypothetical protein n=1 Tax=Magnetospirillum sp. UT-4 TaxID=2681467 RepID=UPI00137F9261|nr:hypothetical protein [Magnetospirillum sp. UT-4]CAA7617694.1 conserved membrane hypothetical protein [Magnetospirillum sp. UT-4]
MNALGSAAGLAWAPLLPWPLLAALAAAALAVWGLAAWRRARGRWWRLLALAALLLALANPRLVAEERRPLPDIALVVVDDTPSQGLGDRRAETEAALAGLRAKLAALPGLEVRVERVGGAGQSETRLFEAVDRALADAPRQRLAGVVMITDGRVHDVPADSGRSLGAPLHALVTGRPGERDRRLALTRGPDYAMVGRTATVGFKVEESGPAAAARVEVRIDGRLHLTAEMPANREATVEVPVRHAGATVVEVAVEPGPGELTLANNRTAITVTGVRDRLKVLLVSGQPHAGERIWRNLLKADPAVDLVHFTILRPPEKDDLTPIRELALITFPVRELFEERLGDFDLVVFDRYRRRGVLTELYHQRLVEFVRGGGALLVADGPDPAGGGGLYDSALGDILPAIPTGTVRNEAFRPLPTPLGRRHPVTAALPGGEADPPRWGSWIRLMEVSLRRGNALLAGGGERPLLVLDEVGEGRVAQLLSDTFWLWARGYEGGGPHDELLRRLAHWLMKEPQLEAEALAAEVKDGRLEVVRRSLAPPPATVTATRPDGSPVEVALTDHGDGRATGSVAADQPGLWRVEDGALSAVAAAGDLGALELAEPTATDRVLAPVAEATGGSVRFLAEGGMPELRRTGPGRLAAGRDWIGLAARGEHQVTGIRDIALAPALVLLAAALGALMAAWRREGR